VLLAAVDTWCPLTLALLVRLRRDLPAMWPGEVVRNVHL
jgi:hypothetical protein